MSCARRGEGSGESGGAAVSVKFSRPGGRTGVRLTLLDQRLPAGANEPSCLGTSHPRKVNQSSRVPSPSIFSMCKWCWSGDGKGAKRRCWVERGRSGAELDWADRRWSRLAARRGCRGVAWMQEPDAKPRRRGEGRNGVRKQDEGEREREKEGRLAHALRRGGQPRAGKGQFRVSGGEGGQIRTPWERALLRITRPIAVSPARTPLPFPSRSAPRCPLAPLQGRAQISPARLQLDCPRTR